MQSWVTSPAVIQRLQSATLARLKWMAQCRADQRLSLECRLAGFLLRAYFRTQENADSRVLNLTRQSLADAVGASVESVIRTMKKWETCGLVTSASKVIRVEKVKSLREIYEGPRKPIRKPRKGFKT